MKQPVSATKMAGDIRALLAAHADPVLAPPMQAYMRGQFVFYGIKTVERRAITREFVRQAKHMDAPTLLACAQKLWSAPQRECQYAAVDLLASGEKILTAENIPALLALVQKKSWWDTVDTLAKIIGGILRRARSKSPGIQLWMDDALEHDDFWVRRIAMLHQLGWRNDTDAKRLFAYATKLAPETEFFIRKAVGWALRDYARDNPRAVARFLKDMGDRLSPLTRREAARHLPTAAPPRRKKSA